METLDNKQLIEILKKRRGKLPVTQFQKQVKVVSTQFLAKVLTGEYYIGPKIAKFLGYEQVVRFVKAKAKRPAKAKASKKAARKKASGKFKLVSTTQPNRALAHPAVSDKEFNRAVKQHDAAKKAAAAK